MGRLIALLLSLAASLAACRVTAAEPWQGNAPAGVSTAAAFSANDLWLYHDAYHAFPRRVQAANDAIALAELEAAYWAGRVESYRPFRSFGVYGATYHVDRLAQIQLVAAQQRLDCLTRAKGDLWRERQAVAQAALGQRELADQKSQPR
jgi:hypothetical protein